MWCPKMCPLARWSLLPSSGPSEPSPGVSAENPLPPSIVDAPSATDSFVDAPSAKDTRKEEELVQSKEPRAEEGGGCNGSRRRAGEGEGAG